MKVVLRRLLLGCATAAAVLLLASPLLLRLLERQMIETGPNGTETPASAGLPYERLTIPSGQRRLDAFLVRAPLSCEPHVTLLIFHGAGETISDWVHSQRMLYDACISSLVFDYSGNGRSTGPGTTKNLDQDAVAAYNTFMSHFSSGETLCVLGFSMGNAVLLQAYPAFQPTPACVVIAGAFSSGRESAQSHWQRIPHPLLMLFPDQWNNVSHISRIRSRLLVVHSDADQVNPEWMGERIFEAAPQPKQLVVLHGLPHTASYRNPSMQWWGPVIQFLQSRGG